MATQLNKKLVRELVLPHQGRTMMVELLPGDQIAFRLKGTRTRYTVSLHSVFYLALMQKLDDEHKAKLQRYNERKKLGLRAKRPNARYLGLFTKRMQTIFKVKPKVG